MKNDKVKSKSKITKLSDALRLIGYLKSSFDDYISARILFNNNKLIQGCCLANTAIEKYLKAFIYFRGNTIKAKHDLKKLFPSIKNFAPDVYQKLNTEFLEEVSKIYLMRYLDNCERGYNFVILRNKYLAELDYTYSIIEPKIRVKPQRDKEIRKTNYELAVENKNPELWINNYILNKIDKSDFIEATDIVHELRIYEHNNELIEAIYLTDNSKNDNKFRFEGLAPKGDHKSFEMSHKLKEK